MLVDNACCENGQKCAVVFGEFVFEGVVGSPVERKSAAS
jgi:hypothetical protein